MKFVPRKSGLRNRSIYLDPEMNTKEFPEIDSIEPLLHFPCDSYKKLNSDSDIAIWEGVFGAINYALANMSTDERKFFALGYAQMHSWILDMPPDKVGEEEVIQRCGVLFTEIIEKCRLLELFRPYVASKLDTKAPVLTSEEKIVKQAIGEALHSEKLTFHPHELQELIVLALFCKMLAPIYSVLISKFPKVPGKDGRMLQPTDREPRCHMVTLNFIGKYFRALAEKLKGYIHHTVVKCCANNPNVTAAKFAGLTDQIRTESIYANAIVRNFVNLDIFYTESNIMRYCDSIVRTLVSTQNGSANKNQTRIRTAYGSKDEVSNSSQIEVDSVVSSTTMDAPMIIEVVVEKHINTLLALYDVPQHEFDGILEYFRRHPFIRTPLLEFITNTFYAEALGGARSVQLCDPEIFTKMVAMLQIIAFCKNYPNLGHMLTMRRALEVRSTRSSEDTIFKLNSLSVPEASWIKSQFDNSPASTGREWERCVNGIVDDMLLYQYMFNTPPYIWNALEEACPDIEDTNGQVVINDAIILQELYAFIEECLRVD